MTARRKQTFRDRARKSINEHKVVSIGALIGAIVLLWPIAKELWPAVMWLDNHWQRKSEADAHSLSDKIEFARGELRDSSAMEFMTRRAVIDCAAKTERKTIARTEDEACKQYVMEYDKAVDRQKDARKRLQDLRAKAP